MWDREHEAMPRDQLEALQLQRLQEKVGDVYERVPFYKKQAMKRRGITPEDI
jgi:phenylacetate-CoA ligase